MAWHQKKNRPAPYYFRNRKVNGIVKSEYFGRGPIAEAAAAFDAQKAKAREEEATKERLLLKLIELSNAEAARIDKISKVWTHAKMVAGGMYQHARGPWRKRHGKKS